MAHAALDAWGMQVRPGDMDQRQVEPPRRKVEHHGRGGVADNSWLIQTEDGGVDKGTVPLHG